MCAPGAALGAGDSPGGAHLCPAGLAEGLVASAEANARVCACVCTWGAVRATAEGGKAAAGPAPGRSARGGSSASLRDRSLRCRRRRRQLCYRHLQALA
ncbi:unnamed protein product [Rangifer tarandus platyrhynchus]|uniref:Uncharacterized protein n=2 Tax=Rangifer tarandus platyrhynchus TaxID=3082113 RepID=A0ABN8ZRQ6_RANTA|nr:unnamed protein product [Rangifer tarandus platyrhynchus]CAI9709831.1 unnamed protein product [Rangifer tarandus platyrhynchus]